MREVEFAYMRCPQDFKRKISQMLAEDFIADDLATLHGYGHDMTENLHYYPDAVARPRTVKQVSEILQLANRQRIPVTTRGRGTGLAGAALPIHGGLCLSMEYFDRIIAVDRANLQATVEPYVKNFTLQERVKEFGLFYPPDPASYRICSLGGNLSHNSGGPKAVKYGTTRSYVLQIEAVLADGRPVVFGSRTLKNSTGYSLKDLIIGSEGTLAVITRATLRLIPCPRYERLLQASFASLEACARTVHRLLLAGLNPSGLELMERTALEHAKAYCRSEFPTLEADTAAHLLVELDGNSEAELDQQLEQTRQLLSEEEEVQHLHVARDERQKAQLWLLRRNVYMGIKAQGVSKEMDFCVPIASLPATIAYMRQVGEKQGFCCATYGHAGDGNLHAGIIPQPGRTPEEVRAGVDEIFRYVCREQQGTISAEHGIGLVQQPFIGWRCSAAELELMAGIKRVFDPHNILNPGKIFTERARNHDQGNGAIDLG